jgi:hypothetical protein
VTRARWRKGRARLAGTLAALGVATTAAVGLAQQTTSAAFTGSTGDGVNTVTAAASFCVSSGGVTLDVVNDTYVDASDPATGKGGATGLVVRSGPSVAHVYLRFTLPSQASFGHRCRLTGATLRLHATTSQGPGTIDVHRASATWTSAGTTWNTAGRPGPAGTEVGVAAGTTGWHEWDVTTLVRELYTGPDHGFLVKDRNEAVGTRTTTYESLDSPTVANRPELVLTWG